MKQLRILTGIHSGTQLSLPQGATIIGADEEAHFQISDWPERRVTLHVREEDGWTVVMLDDGHSSQMLPFTDFMPMRFGEVVVCVGSAKEKWPSDVRLMERLMAQQGAPSKARKGRLHRWAMGLGIALAIPLLYGFTSVVMGRPNPSTLHPEPLLGRVHNAIKQARLDGVIARPSGSHVAVEGLLDTSADVVALRNALHAFPSELIEQNFGAIPDLCQAISEALADKGVAVSYVSHGRFLVSGESLEVSRLQQAAQRVMADLSPLVTKIDLAVRQLPPPPRQSVGAMLSVDGVEYVQTKDGIKHLSILPLALAELTD